MSICPNCTKNIKPFSLSFSVFPFYFKCADCNVRLKLVSSKLFWATFLLYSMIIIASINYIPLLREYNLGVIIAVSGWFLFIIRSHFIYSEMKILIFISSIMLTGRSNGHIQLAVLVPHKL